MKELTKDLVKDIIINAKENKQRTNRMICPSYMFLARFSK
jgi:hypothetical protein